MKFPALIFFVLFTSFAFGQTDETIRVDTSLVRLNIGVVDRQGKPVRNLSRENFAIYEDGAPQKILNFQPTEAPFSLVLLMDVSGSTKAIRQLMVQSASRFVDSLSPEDRVAVVSFNEKNRVLRDFTTNRKDIYYAISLVGSQKEGGQTRLYDALRFSLEKLKNENKRRTAIVVLTDGVDTVLEADDRRTFKPEQAATDALGGIKPEQNPQISAMLDFADKNGVTIFPLALPSGDPKRIADPTPFQVAKYTAARERLQYVANRTGGNFNVINRLEDMTLLYAAVAAQLRTIYSIEYQSSNGDKKSGKWRTISINVNSPEVFAARTRPGYYAR
jgi:VWFA-related protein